MDDALLALGGLLRRQRESRGWTQEQLAERAGAMFSVETVSKIERGRSRPRRHTLQQLITALELDDAERDAILIAWGKSSAGVSPLEAAAAAHEMAERPVGGYLGVWPERSLVARAEELSRIITTLETTAGGAGRLVLLSGEAGIGKTRLAQEVAAEALKRSFVVAAGRSYEAQQDVPFFPFREALASLVDDVTRKDGADATQRWPNLARLLPGKLERRHSDENTGPEEQQRLYLEVNEFVRTVAMSRPVALLLDDLHWADSASLELFLYLARHTRGDRVFLLGTYRDVGLRRHHPLHAVRHDLIRDGLVERVGLHPLKREQTDALVSHLAGRPLPGDLREVIHSRTEGNPFFIEQVFFALQDHADAEGVSLDALSDVREVPDSVRLAIQQRMDRLSEKTQRVLYEASALGQSFGFAELHAMSEYEESDLEGVLDEVIEAGLIRDLGDDTYTFDHALTQKAIYGELSSRRKRRLHEAAGEALEQLAQGEREDRTAEIAWHFHQARDQERALPWTLKAGGEAAAIFAHRDAEMQYRKAAQLARDLGRERVESEALDKLGDVLYRSGRYADALAPLQQAAAIYERLGEREAYIRAVARIGEAYHFGGRATDGLEHVLPVVRALEDRGLTASPTHSLADLYSALCTLFLGCARFQDALSTAEVGISIAESAGNLRALCTIEISRGLALGVANRIAEQRLAFERAAEIAEPLGDAWLLALAVFHHGVSYLAGDAVVQGEQQMRRALHIADRAALGAWATFIRLSLSDLYVTHGRWEEARREAERAVDDSGILGPRPGGSYPLISLGRILLLEGERDEGLRFLRDGLAMATRYEHLPGVIRAHESLAWQEVRDANPEAALARLDALFERSPAARQVVNAAVYASALLEVGDQERAAEALNGARQRATLSPSRAGLPQVLLQSARLATQQERWVDAVRDLWEGIAIAQELELPYDEALLLQELGRMHAARGETEQAHMRLQSALTIFHRLGATSDIEHLEHPTDVLTLPERPALAPVTPAAYRSRQYARQAEGRLEPTAEEREESDRIS